MRKCLKLMAGLLVLVCMVGMLAGCGGAQELAVYKDGEKLLELGMTYDEMIESLGRPEDERDAFLEGASIVEYDGLMAYLKDDVIFEINITGKEYADSYGISPGMPFDKAGENWSSDTYNVLTGSAPITGYISLDENKQVIPIITEGSQRKLKTDLAYMITYKTPDDRTDVIEEITISKKIYSIDKNGEAEWKDK